MTTTQDSTLVFKDRAGDYYLLPQQMLERGRVPAEHVAEIERLIASIAVRGGIDGEDVQGHAVPAFAAGAFGAGFAVGFIAVCLFDDDVPLAPLFQDFIRRNGG